MTTKNIPPYLLDTRAGQYHPSLIETPWFVLLSVSFAIVFTLSLPENTPALDDWSWQPAPCQRADAWVLLGTISHLNGLISLSNLHHETRTGSWHWWQTTDELALSFYRMIIKTFFTLLKSLILSPTSPKRALHLLLHKEGKYHQIVYPGLPAHNN